MAEPVDNSACDNWFNECDDKQNLSWLQILKMLVKKGPGGCPVLATDAAVTIGDISVDLDTTNELLTDIKDELVSQSGEVTKETRNVIAAGAGAITAGARKVNIINYDSADALVDGVVLPGGLSIPYKAGQNKTLPAFTYDAQTSKLFITIIR